MTETPSTIAKGMVINCSPSLGMRRRGLYGNLTVISKVYATATR